MGSPHASGPRASRSASRPLARMAFRNVRKNWRHSLGTVLAIAVGFVAISLFEGYLRDLFERQAEGYSRKSMYGDVLIQRVNAASDAAREEPWKFRLGEREQAFLEAYLRDHAAEVTTRSRFLNMTGLASTGGAGALWIGYGFDVAEGAVLRGKWRWNALAGHPLVDPQASEVILGKGLAALLDCVPATDEPWARADGTPIEAVRPMKCRRTRLQLTATTETGQVNVVEPQIAGIFSSGLKELDGRLLTVPLPVAQKLLDTSAVSLYSLLLARPEQADAFAGALTAAAKQAGLDIEAMHWTKHPSAELYRRGHELLGIFRSFMVLIVVTIAGMSVLMTMMRSVSERTREIGTLRSLGFLRRHIVTLFALEGAMLAALSACVGFVATVAATALINASGVTYSAGVLSEKIPLVVAWSPRSYVFALVFLSVVAMVAALVPARRASRMGIPDALGHV